MSQSAGDGPDGVRYVSADLDDAEACKRAVGDAGITHLVYGARANHALYTTPAPHARIGIEDVGPNMAMLRNTVEAYDETELRHVHAIPGGKWYCMHLGPYATPAHESDPGHLPPNFSFSQQSYLETRLAISGWTWSTSRPNILCGVTPCFRTNLLSTLGDYAAICRHLGRSFNFPGKPGNFISLQGMTEARLLAEAIFWMCRTPEAHNNVYNLINGDLIRWENVWPLLFEHFDVVKPGRPRHFSLVQWMADKGPVWDAIVQTHGLQPLPIEWVASWGFADFLLSWDFDVISSTTKIRQAGYHRTVDTESMILSQLGEYRRFKILP